MIIILIGRKWARLQGHFCKGVEMRIVIYKDDENQNPIFVDKEGRRCDELSPEEGRDMIFILLRLISSMTSSFLGMSPTESNFKKNTKLCERLVDVVNDFIKENK